MLISKAKQNLHTKNTSCSCQRYFILVPRKIDKQPPEYLTTNCDHQSAC